MAIQDHQFSTLKKGADGRPPKISPEFYKAAIAPTEEPHLPPSFDREAIGVLESLNGLANIAVLGFQVVWNSFFNPIKAEQTQRNLDAEMDRVFGAEQPVKPDAAKESWELIQDQTCEACPDENGPCVEVNDDCGCDEPEAPAEEIEEERGPSPRRIQARNEGTDPGQVSAAARGHFAQAVQGLPPADQENAVELSEKVSLGRESLANKPSSAIAP